MKLRRKKSSVRIEPGAMDALRMELLGYTHLLEHFIHITKENMHNFREMFTLNFIEYFSYPTRTKYFLFGQVNNFIKQCYRIRNVSVSTILI